MPCKIACKKHKKNKSVLLEIKSSSIKEILNCSSLSYNENNISYNENNTSLNKEEDPEINKFGISSSVQESIMSLDEENDHKLINKSEEQKIKSDINHGDHSEKIADYFDNSNINLSLEKEKKNFTEIIKSKILKINNLNLCKDFNNFIDFDKFSQFCDLNMKIKIFNSSLAQIKIPPFRNFAKNSDKVESWIKRQTTVPRTSMVIVTKSRLYLIIGLLFLVAVLFIVFLVYLLVDQN